MLRSHPTEKNAHPDDFAELDRGLARWRRLVCRLFLLLRHRDSPFRLPLLSFSAGDYVDGPAWGSVQGKTAERGCHGEDLRRCRAVGEESMGKQRAGDGSGGGGGGHRNVRSGQRVSGGAWNGESRRRRGGRIEEEAISAYLLVGRRCEAARWSHCLSRGRTDLNRRFR
jgi:hypothetical protein